MRRVHATATEVFGIWDDITVEHLNRLLKSHGVKLRRKVNRRRWASQVQITAVRTDGREGFTPGFIVTPDK